MDEFAVAGLDEFADAGLEESAREDECWSPEHCAQEQPMYHTCTTTLLHHHTTQCVITSHSACCTYRPVYVVCVQYHTMLSVFSTQATDVGSVCKWCSQCCSQWCSQWWCRWVSSDLFKLIEEQYTRYDIHKSPRPAEEFQQLCTSLVPCCCSCDGAVGVTGAAAVRLMLLLLYMHAASATGA